MIEMNDIKLLFKNELEVFLNNIENNQSILGDFDINSLLSTKSFGKGYISLELGLTFSSKNEKEDSEND